MRNLVLRQALTKVGTRPARGPEQFSYQIGRKEAGKVSDKLNDLVRYNCLPCWAADILFHATDQDRLIRLLVGQAR